MVQLVKEWMGLDLFFHRGIGKEFRGDGCAVTGDVGNALVDGIVVLIAFFGKSLIVLGHADGLGRIGERDHASIGRIDLLASIPRGEDILSEAFQLFLVGFAHEKGPRYRGLVACCLMAQVNYNL